MEPGGILAIAEDAPKPFGRSGKPAGLHHTARRYLGVIRKIVEIVYLMQPHRRALDRPHGPRSCMIASPILGHGFFVGLLPHDVTTFKSRVGGRSYLTPAGHQDTFKPPRPRQGARCVQATLPVRARS